MIMTHLRHTLAPGRHCLTAVVKNIEFFGWGLIVNLRGDNVKYLPASLA